MGAFDLLHDAEDASGDEAVSKVRKAAAARRAADKAKARADAEARGEVWVDPDEAKPPKDAHKKKGPAAGANKEGQKKQPQPSHTQQQQQPTHEPQQKQPDGEGEEYPRENNARGHGRGHAIVGGSGGGFQGGRGNFRVLEDANGNRFFEGGRGYNNGNRGGYGYNNGNRSYNYGGRPYNNGYSNGNAGDNQVNNGNNGQYQQAYNENNGQYQQDGHYSSNSYGQRQGYRREDGQSRKQYVPKSKPASEAASDADQKSEEKVEEPAAEAPQKEASAENVDAAPASESEKSAGDVAKDETKKVDGEGGEPKPKRPKDPNFKRLTGSQRRKLKNKNPKKEDSNDGDASKNTTDNVPEVIEEEKQEMTLEEYEKKLGKKKASEASKPEETMVALEEAFEGFKLLEKKKIEDDDRVKLENGQRKAREAAAKEGKARKLTIQEYLKPADGTEYVVPRRDGPASGGYKGGRGNGGFSGRDNRTESRVYNSGNGNNPIVFHAVDATNGKGMPRRDVSRERRDVSWERRDGGYQQGERREGGYNGFRGNGGYQQGGYNGGRGNGVYQERRDSYNGERREGGYNGGNQERREVGNQQGGGYQERRQGGYQQGGYSGGRGNGGYQQGGGRGYGGRGYGGRGGARKEPEVPQPDSAVHFPALGAAAPAANAPSPTQSQA